MRVIVWLTLGFGAACAGCGYLLPRVPVWPLGILFALLCGGCYLASMRVKTIKQAALVFLGCTAGLLWWQIFDNCYLGAAREADGQVRYAVFEIRSFSEQTRHGSCVYGYTELDGKTYYSRIYMEEEILQPGDMVEGRFLLRVTAADGTAENPGYAGSSVFLTASARGELRIIKAQSVPLKYLPVLLRQRLLALLDTVFPSDTAAFAKALLIGDRGDLDYETDTALQLSGIKHIVAVSGLHVTILCGTLYMVMGRKRFITPLLGFSVLLLFAAVVGFTPSITRAAVMMGLMLLALLIRREYDPPTALAFSALLMMVCNPMVVQSVSFQLSFGCMVGIFLFSTRLRTWLLSESRLGAAKGNGLLARGKRWFADSLSVTLSAMVFTTPLVAWYFGVVSLVSPLTNLLVLWAVTFCFCGVLGVSILGSIWMPLGKLLAWGISWLMRYVLLVAKGLAALPFAAVYTRSKWIIVWLAFCYVLLLLGIAWKGRRVWLCGMAAVVSLCLAVGCSWTNTMSGAFQMTALDVGQGQCLILQSDGKTFVVDCGGDYAKGIADLASQTLLSRGISRIDGLILTHFDADHSGAAQMLMQRIQTDAVYIPGYEENAFSEMDLARVVRSQTQLSYSDTVITLIPSESGDTGNESSLCVLFQTEKCDILITGDRSWAGEMELLEQIMLPKLEVLVAGHHGAATSTCQALLDATRPETVIVSVGEDNIYGHPAKTLLDRLEAAGCTVLRTDLEGTIDYRG